jgi:hypothetical protein
MPGEDNHVKGMDRLRMFENQQGIGLTQAAGRDGEAHMGNDPTGQEASYTGIRQPKEPFHH